MKAATLIVFLLLGLAFTYAVPVEDEVTEDEPAAEDELVENDDEIAEDKEDEDDEKRALPYRPRRRPCRICRVKLINKYKKLYRITLCVCKGRCRYSKYYRALQCYSGYKCRSWVSRYGRCPRRY